MQQLQQWKASPHRKPLIIRGARQVGKTWLAQEFGRLTYQSVAYINLDGNTQAERLFSLDYNIERIVDGLELLSGIKIEPNHTLIILDEIQEVPRALSALKYFYETAPHYHVVALGSLLGVALHQNTSFPVGKVDFIDLYPLTFLEFLEAAHQQKFARLIKDEPLNSPLLATFHDSLIDMLKTYYIVGGMPEVVLNYLNEGNLLQVRQVQQAILTAYEHDFSKHAPVNVVPRIREIWDVLPSQLAKENKRFFFRMIRDGARSKEYEAALRWLEDAGLVRRIGRVNEPLLPLSVYADMSIFKLFISDIGLLGAKSGLEPEVILNKNDIFVEFKGALAEQFVFQELTAHGGSPYYYANNSSRGEIDFLLSRKAAILPIEVKSGKNIRATSLQNFIDKHPHNRAIVLSTRPHEMRRSVTFLPLFMAYRLLTD